MSAPQDCVDRARRLILTVAGIRGRVARAGLRRAGIDDQVIRAAADELTALGIIERTRGGWNLADRAKALRILRQMQGQTA